MKSLFTTLTLILALACSAIAQTETVQVDITKLTQQELMVYQQLKLKSQNAMDVSNITPEKIDKYAQIGKSFGTAFKECWTTVSSDAEKFAQSDAGKLTMFLIAWKIVGQDGINLVEKAVQYIIGIPLLFSGTLIFVWIIRRNCFSRPRLVESTKVGWMTVKKVYEGTTGPLWGGEETFVATICFAIFILLCCAITFMG